VFNVYCPTHRAQVLLGLSRIRALTNVNGLIVIDLECDDGEQLRHYTGRRYRESLGSDHGLAR
jgi:hypothetical protein